MFHFLGVVSSLTLASAHIMGVDLGNQYFKAAMVRPSKFDIVHNLHSKRKTPTAVSFAESVRLFGDDAIPHQGKSGDKVPMFFSYTLGTPKKIKRRYVSFIKS